MCVYKMGWMIYACVCLCACALLWRVYGPWRRYRRARRLLGHLPCFARLPGLGNLHLVLGDGEYFLHQLTTMSKMMEVHQSPFVLWLGPQALILVSVPEDVKTVGIAFGSKVGQYAFSSNTFGEGLVTSPWSLYKHTSKKLSVAFNSHVVAEYQHIFNAQAEKLVKELKNEVGREPFDIFRKYIDWMSMQTIYHATFGVPNIPENGVTKDYLIAFSKVIRLYSKRGLLIYQYPDFLYKLSSDAKTTAKYERIINRDAEKMISHRKKEREIEKNVSLKTNERPEGEVPGFKPYIDILLDLQETDPVFNHKQIISELNTVISAGHDTVANTLAIAILMIGSHQDVQDKIYDEMKNIFGDSKRPVTKEDMAEMRYCEAVICETLRLYPAGPLVIREADRDLELRQCTIPSGTMCAINIWGSGRSKHIWGDDAEVFRPERWLERPDFNPFFIPFSYGKRPCIGKKYSMAMLKTTLAHCVRELVFSADTKRLRLRLYVTLQPFRGHEIRVQLRG